MNDSYTLKPGQTFSSLLRYCLSCSAVALLIYSPSLVAQTSPTATEEEPAIEPNPVDAPAQAKETQQGCGCCRGAKGQSGGSGASQGAGGGKGRGSGASQGAGCGKGRGRGSDEGPEGQRGSHAGRPEMQLAHYLIDNHKSLQRSVEYIPGGVRTRTTTTDPDLVESLREHVRQMAALIDGSGRIRNWDPLFREIFNHRQSIEIKIDDVDEGVEVVETSTDEEVALLIQAHARKVDEFVARGRAAYREETPLPDGYSRTSP